MDKATSLQNNLTEKMQENTALQQQKLTLESNVNTSHSNIVNLNKQRETQEVEINNLQKN